MKINRLFKTTIFITCVLGLLSGCASPMTTSNRDEQSSPITNTSLPLNKRVDKIVNQLSTEEKVGQLVMIGIHGTDLNDDSKFMPRSLPKN